MWVETLYSLYEIENLIPRRSMPKPDRLGQTSVRMIEFYNLYGHGQVCHGSACDCQPYSTHMFISGQVAQLASRWGEPSNRPPNAYMYISRYQPGRKRQNIRTCKVLASLGSLDIKHSPFTPPYSDRSSIHFPLFCGNPLTGFG